MSSTSSTVAAVRPRLVEFALGLVVLILLGGPLVGRGVFAGTDILERFDPWATTAPDLGPAENLLRGDEVDVRLPARRQIVEGLRAGDLPLWQSDVNGGRPLAAVPNTSSLSPVNAPYWVLPFHLAPAWAKLVEVLLAIAGTAALLARHGVRRDVGLLAGFLVGFAGYQLVWTGSPVAPLAALFPAFLWSVDRALDRRRPSAHLPLVALVAVGWLQGFPALFLVELFLAGVWALWSTLGRVPPRELVRPLAGLLAAVVTGTLLALFQLATFLAQLGRIDTGGRAQSVLDHLPFDHLLTTALPYALGGVDDWAGVRNLSEAHLWLGVVPLALLGLWAWRGVPDGARRLQSFLVAVGATTFVLVWLGGLPLRLAQLTPLFSINQVARIRTLAATSVILLGALALEAHLAEPSARPDRMRALRGGDPAAAPEGGARNHRMRWIRGLRVGVLGALGVAVVVAGLPGAVDAARRVGQGARLQADLAILVGGVVAVAGLLWGARRRAVVAAVLVPGLVLLAGAETLRLTRDLWPVVPDEAFYPSTPAHEFLAAAQGDDRVASAELALYPGTTTWYGIRTVAGHAFPPVAWRELLLALDPAAYDRSETMPLLAPTARVARSPLLDRLAARWWVTDLDHPPIGDPARLLLRAVDDGPGTAVALLPADVAFRAVVLPPAVGVVSTPTTVTTQVLDAEGTVVEQAQRRLLPGRLERPVVLTVPEAAGASLRVTWSDGAVPPAALGEFDAVVAPPGDPLVLAFSDGVVAYERTRALPRFRWATDHRTSRGNETLFALASGDVPATTALVEGPRVPDATGGAAVADLDVRSADGDHFEVGVVAADPGLLVVADSLQDDWVATVDGEAVPLRRADHVGVAVAVPAGTHDVVLAYRPPTVRWAGTVSAATLVLLVVALAAVAARRRRRDRPRDRRPEQA